MAFVMGQDGGIVVQLKEAEAGSLYALGWVLLLITLLGGIALIYFSPLFCSFLLHSP